MIIAAYAGTGKSTFAAQVEDAVDLAVMPYRWILPERTDGETEGEKAAPWLLGDPNYPDNYIEAVLRAERQYRYVIIPTQTWVIERLHKRYGRKVVVCCPTDDCKEEYRQRFLRWGNSENFLDIFIGSWADILSRIRESEGVVQIPLGPGEYLTDLKSRLDAEQAQDAAGSVPEEDLDRLRAENETGARRCVLQVSGYLDDCLYFIPDIRDPEERDFLYGIGRTLWELNLSRIIEPPCLFERLESRADRERVDRAGLLTFLEKERAAISAYESGRTD